MPGLLVTPLQLLKLRPPWGGAKTGWPFVGFIAKAIQMSYGSAILFRVWAPPQGGDKKLEDGGTQQPL
jgi:hypothetical protein